MTSINFDECERRVLSCLVGDPASRSALEIAISVGIPASRCRAVLKKLAVGGIVDVYDGIPTHFVLAGQVADG